MERRCQTTRKLSIPFPFVNLIYKIYDYPVGSDASQNVEKLRVKSGFIMKHILEMQVKHGIHAILYDSECW